MKTITRAAFSSCIVLAILAFGSVAHAKTAYTAAELKSILAPNDATLKLVADKDGAPQVLEGTVKNETGEFKYFIRLKDCVGNTHACQTLIFFANWDLGRDTTPDDLEIANSYNDTHPFGRVYVLTKKSQIGVDYVVDVRTGVDNAFLNHSSERWSEVITNFVKHFRKKAAEKTK